MSSLTLTNEKKTEFEFDISIQGVPAQDAVVRFILEGAAYDTAINCSRSTSNMWVAKVPAIQIDESVHSFRIEVVAGGYYFCPTKGAINVVSPPRIKIAEMIQKDEPVSVSVSVSNITDDRPTLVMLESMESGDRSHALARCKSAGKILGRAASVIEERPMTTQKIIGVMEAVKKALGLLETQFYR